MDNYLDDYRWYFEYPIYRIVQQGTTKLINMTLLKIISGGQTGGDRAALDAAIEMKIPYGGWCPKGRLAELGTTIPTKYILQETTSATFEERTKLNIRDSDGTLILVPETPIKVTDGTILTIE